MRVSAKLQSGSYRVNCFVRGVSGAWRDSRLTVHPDDGEGVIIPVPGRIGGQRLAGPVASLQFREMGVAFRARIDFGHEDPVDIGQGEIIDRGPADDENAAGVLPGGNGAGGDR